MERMKICLVDAGHGAINPYTGKYTTAPRKMFLHQKGEFHGGGWFYEGVFNRQVAAKFQRKLLDARIGFSRLYHEFLDNPLGERVRMVRGNATCLVSFHANASLLHNARGTEVYTTRGNTKADELASYYWQYLEEASKPYGIKLRTDKSDGDPDKEADFRIIHEVKPPAILIETLFFDQYDDAMLLMQDDVQDMFATCAFKAVADFMKKNVRNG